VRYRSAYARYRTRLRTPRTRAARLSSGTVCPLCPPLSRSMLLGCRLFEREQLLADATDTKRFNLMNWIVFFLIGTGTGTTAFLIDKGVDKLLEIRWDATYDTLIGLNAAGERTVDDTSDDNVMGAFFVDVLICGLYVAVASGLVVWVEPAAAGSGIPDMKGYLNGTNLRGALTSKALVAKAVGVVFSVGGGLCVGKEGPLVHTGSVLGANISHGFNLCTARFKKWNRFRNDSFKRDFVSGGCAAGVAAAFGAPMGGVLFAFEEASSFWSLPLTWKCFFCAATSTFTLNFLLASTSEEGVWNGINSPTLITFGTFKDQPYALWELPIFAGLAVVGGLLGAVFNEINFKLSVWRRDRGWGKPQKQLECVLTAMLTGAVFFILPRFWNEQSDCRPLPDGLDRVHNSEVRKLGF
jgi:chloride channel 7